MSERLVAGQDERAAGKRARAAQLGEVAAPSSLSGDQTSACVFQGALPRRCGMPAVGVCTLCGDATCRTHIPNHWHVRLFAAKGEVA